MFQGDITERRNKYYNKELYSPDERRNNSFTTHNMIFPYIGPPGSGPGLLGNRPGAGKTEYLTALEHNFEEYNKILPYFEKHGFTLKIAFHQNLVDVSNPSVNLHEMNGEDNIYAAGLKRALTIITELKNQKNKDLDVEVVYDSICSIESELKNKNDDSASSL